MTEAKPDRRFVLICLVAAASGLPRSAAAHAILLSSHPASKATIPPGPLRLDLTFNSRIDATRSSLTLTRPDKTRTPVPLLSVSEPDRLTAVTEVEPGPHVLRWQVLALDGHITRGDVPFTVADS